MYDELKVGSAAQPPSTKIKQQPSTLRDFTNEFLFQSENPECFRSPVENIPEALEALEMAIPNRENQNGPFPTPLEPKWFPTKEKFTSFGMSSFQNGG